jgi:hypothetical protein
VIQQRRSLMMRGFRCTVVVSCGNVLGLLCAAFSTAFRTCFNLRELGLGDSIGGEESLQRLRGFCVAEAKPAGGEDKLVAKLDRTELEASSNR